ncbi:hypothetical protein U2F10_24100 [Leptothoe sp. EHU-05/26/07-4]
MPQLTTAYTLSLQWLESEGYQLIDQGIYSKQPELDGPLEIQVVGAQATGHAHVQVVDTDDNWADLPEIVCHTTEQFIAVVRNLECLAKKLGEAES